LYHILLKEESDTDTRQ